MDEIHYRDEQELAHSMVSRWMQSSGHRANILDPENSAIGSAVAHGSGDDIYGTQVFAPHVRRGIPSRDYSVRGAAAGEDFYVDLVPGDPLKPYSLRASSEGSAGDLIISREKDSLRVGRPATLPAVIRFELEDDSVRGVYHLLCQIRIELNEEGTPVWSWEPWESM